MKWYVGYTYVNEDGDALDNAMWIEDAFSATEALRKFELVADGLMYKNGWKKYFVWGVRLHGMYGVDAIKEVE